MMRDELLQDSSNSDSSEEEDEDAKELTEDVEKKFFKALSYIKKKDPQIYNENVKFFTKDESGGSQDQNKSKKKKKETPLNLRAYERKLIVERGGELSDEEQEFNDEEGRTQSPTYTEEQRELKESFNKVKLDDESDNDEETWGGLFRKRDKTTQDVKKEEEEYREWLKGQKNDLTDKEAKEDLKYLHDYWTDPKLDKEEQFLRDYILNKRFLEKDIEPEVDMNKLLEEEKELEEQTEFEQKYNYRFEEPDQEFIKRYPRVMANSLRLKDERRKEKRDEVKERKTKEKEKKKEEIKKKKKIKKEEIEAKLEELKKLTGNDQLAFESHLNADFDQDEYDRTMKKLFNEEFYSQEDPNFNPKDIMTEEYDGVWDENCVINTEDANDADLNCEDPNFVMDCDYDPTKKNKKEGKGRRARDKHRRTTVSEAVSREKPLFDPVQHCSFQEYVDQYYGIDCEDFIGDLPCRFKYKRVTANNYGLSVEEILAADDKELERWCSMKRIHKVGSEHKEKNDVKMYSKKANDAELKKKILPSLYSENSEKDLENEETGVVKKKIKKKKLKNNLNDDSVISGVKKEENNETKEKGENQINSTLDHENVREHFKLSEDVIVNKKVKKRQRKGTNNDESNKMEESQIENRVTNENGTDHLSPSDKTKANQKVKKVKHNINNNNQDIVTQNNTITKVKFDSINNNEGKVRKSDDSVTSKKKKKENNINLNINGLDISSTEGKSRRQKKNQKAKLLKTKKKQIHKYSETLKIADKYEKVIMKKTAFKEKKNDNKIQISDKRLKAYGIKPKVFKDKLKYGTQFSMFLEG